MDFDQALQQILKYEGGFVNHPSDPGGATNFGVIQATYDTYRQRLSVPIQSVRNITQAEVKAIYQQMYWQPALCDQVELPLNLVLFDTAVNFGVGGSIQFLQAALGVAVDGIAGSQTQAALKAADPKALAQKIVFDRIAYRHQRVRDNASQKVFLRGWLNRDNHLMALVTGGVASDEDPTLEIQKALNKHGYKLTEDGIAGELTLGAIKDFQRRNALDPDGIVGPLTRKALGL